MVPAATAKARARGGAHAGDRGPAGRRLPARSRGTGSATPSRLRKKEYDLDESEVKPYFELNRVLQDGVFFAANQLYGLTFKERHDIPVYQPDVRVFEVFDADGSPLALFYADYFKRTSKSGGAWMDTFVDQSGLLGTKPVVFNVTNFTKPAPTGSPRCSRSTT